MCWRGRAGIELDSHVHEHRAKAQPLPESGCAAVLGPA